MLQRIIISIKINIIDQYFKKNINGIYQKMFSLLPEFLSVTTDNRYQQLTSEHWVMKKCGFEGQSRGRGSKGIVEKRRRSR